MNTQELASQIKVSANELSEVLNVLGIDPAQPLPDTIGDQAIDVYFSNLKRTAVEEKRRLIDIANEVKRALDGLNKQKAADSSNPGNAGSVSGFQGIDSLKYLEDYFFQLTKGQCTAQYARENPYTLWGITWMTLEGTSLGAAHQVANVALGATVDLARELYFRGSAGQQVSTDVKGFQNRIATRAAQQGLNFFDLSGSTLPGSPTEQLQITAGKE